MAKSQWSFTTAVEVSAALKAKKVSAVELARDAIARIERHDGKINAICVRDFDRGLEAARAIHNESPQTDVVILTMHFSEDVAREVLRSGAREWRVRCNTWQLHRDVGAAFYRAVPPRPTPWSRRLPWRVLLGIAATAPGRWLLAKRAK